MAKIRFTGSQRNTFSWSSMGKAKSYSFGPGEVRNVDDGDLPYLLSFGNFSAYEEVVAEEAAVAVVEETKKVDPFITVATPPPAPVLAPVEVVVEVPAKVDPIIPQEEVVEEPEEEVVEDEVVKIDYTSYSKKELIKMCKQRDLDTKGNRDDLIANLVNADNGK